MHTTRFLTDYTLRGWETQNYAPGWRNFHHLCRKLIKGETMNFSISTKIDREWEGVVKGPACRLCHGETTWDASTSSEWDDSPACLWIAATADLQPVTDGFCILCRRGVTGQRARCRCMRGWSWLIAPKWIAMHKNNLRLGSDKGAREVRPVQKPARLQLPGSLLVANGMLRGWKRE